MRTTEVRRSAPFSPIRRSHGTASRAAARRTLSVIFAALASGAPSAHAADGTYVPDWGTGGRILLRLGTFGDLATTIALQRDGKLLLAGQCGMDASRYTLCAGRLRGDGEFDLGFGPNETGRILLNSVSGLENFDSVLGRHGMALQADGRAILGGRWTCGNWAGCAAGLLVRLSADGTAEPNPNSQYGVQYAYNARYAFNTVEAVAIAPDGKIVVAGCTVRADSDPPNYDFGVARFNADLTPDASFGNGGSRVGAFDLGGDYADCATSVAVLPDRTIVAAGSARGSDGRLKAALLKLAADGGADGAFGNNGRVWFDTAQWSTGDVAINAITLDRHGRLVVVGGRQIWDGTDQDFVVARLNATSGAFDTTFGGVGVVSLLFDLAAPFTDVADDVLVQGDGGILVAGEASADSATTVFAVARLYDNGSLDNGFGNGGKSYGTFSPPSQTSNQHDAGRSLALGSGGLFVAGPGREQGGGMRFGVAKLQLDAIFSDGFE
jgi:uncharacterized delta-60 repeat protein